MLWSAFDGTSKWRVWNACGLPPCEKALFCDSLRLCKPILDLNPLRELVSKLELAINRRRQLATELELAANFFREFDPEWELATN
jgi:hypothetical protein